MFTLIACLLAAPATAQTSIYNTNASPYRLIGWISYCSIESFGSIGVSLFWAFTNSTYNLEGAKKAYGLMVACAQLGSIAGPTLVSVGTEAYGVPTIYFCGALCMVAMVLRRRPLSFLHIASARWRGGAAARRLARAGAIRCWSRRRRATPPSRDARVDGVPRRRGVRLLVRSVDARVTRRPTRRRWRPPPRRATMRAARVHHSHAGRLHLRLQPALPPGPDSPRVDEEEVLAGMTEGLVLFWKYHYVKGIFALSCLFMVEVTILDYSMKVLAKAKFDGEHPGDPHAATRAFASFMGVFGQAANGLSFCFSLLGTSMVIRRLGLNRTLLLFPTLCLGAICFVYTTPTLEAVFLAMLLLKGFSYCLNNPCKEILYQPTSSNVKFKAKSWIDVFGARGSKALGSVVTNAFSDSAADLLSYGAFVGMSVASFLIYVAWWQGREFDNLIDGGVKLGEEPEPVPSSAVDDDGEGTSCGLRRRGRRGRRGEEEYRCVT